VHWAHHDRDGRPATKGARSSARLRAGVLRPSVGPSARSRSRRPAGVPATTCSIRSPRSHVRAW